MTKLLGNLNHGLVFVVSAPAGTGKTTLVKMLISEFPCVIRSISFTTRKPRPGEVPGIDYHFVTKEEFEKQIEQQDFLEYVKLYGEYYGTSRKWVREQQMQGKHVILVIDTQGGLQLKGKFPARFIFIKPPSMEVLRKRLTERKTENEEVIEKRLSWASREIEDGRYYDYHIVNDDLKTSYQVLKSIIIAEEHRVVHG
jgi:guanylate kinase